MASDGFYDAGLLRQIATNLFYGWGYNFYRAENQLRADDQLVRSQAAGLLSQTMAAVDAAESDYRREHLPPPSRSKPFPDAEAVTAAQRLERLARAIGALSAAIQHQAAPDNDRMTQRYRDEAGTLETLIQIDERLVGQCDLLRSMVQGLDCVAILAKMADLEAGQEAIHGTLQRREAALMGRG